MLEYYNYEKDHLYEELQNTLSNERNNKTLNSKNDLHYYSFLNQLKLQMIQTKSSIKSTLFYQLMEVFHILILSLQNQTKR